MPVGTLYSPTLNHDILIGTLTDLWLCLGLWPHLGLLCGGGTGSAAAAVLLLGRLRLADELDVAVAV